MSRPWYYSVLFQGLSCRSRLRTMAVGVTDFLIQSCICLRSCRPTLGDARAVYGLDPRHSDFHGEQWKHGRNLCGQIHCGHRYICSSLKYDKPVELIYFRRHWTVGCRRTYLRCRNRSSAYSRSLHLFLCWIRIFGSYSCIFCKLRSVSTPIWKTGSMGKCGRQQSAPG